MKVNAHNYQVSKDLLIAVFFTLNFTTSIRSNDKTASFSNFMRFASRFDAIKGF